ncbi:hypothetical protein [Luteipulveratus mongoliensis]|uniref:Uncharacterized protein n=1 Tax=Luteipulveratus mongoliensis TaxID=571913 RepID=A0A0K1JG61_9MICO|nr:hypothetical protein [Luteipulveratus mongoliensis]AKU15691.1 hypothetical protein VV02_07235 [Luteipulveratus mongoliensis]
MGGDRPYTEAELAQRERDQQDPEFLTWLAAMDDELALFFERDVPDMPADPWSEEGLRHAEQAALRYFWDREPGDLSWRREREKRFRRYLGEVFVRNFEGTWMWIDVNRNGTKAPVVSEPANPEYLQVEGQVDGALGDRTGGAWVQLFGYARRAYNDWVAAGRLSPDEWFDYQVEHGL